MNLMSEVVQDSQSGSEGTGTPKRGGKILAKIVKYRWFMLFVAAPTLLAIVYYGLIASDQYVSDSSFIIKAPGQRGGQMSTLANLIQTTGVSGAQDETDEVVGYIRSRSALRDLSARQDVHAAFSSPLADRLARFPFPGKEDRTENLFKYYNDMIDVGQDHETGLVHLKVKAFAPDTAQALNEGLLKLSEQLVNRLNERSQQQAIRESLKRVAEAEERVKRVRVQLATFRNSQDLIDPEKQATAILDIVSKLTIERASLQAQLNVMQREAPSHPGLPSIRSRISAIDGIIGGQTGQVVGNASAIASKLGRYEALMVEQQFATQLLNTVGAAAEQARGEAAKQHFYLQRIVDPNAPDLAEFPRRIKSILTIFGATICLYFIVWMFVVGILEHAPEE